MGTQLKTPHHIATTCNGSYEDCISVPSCCMFCKPDITLVGIPRVSPHPKARARSSCAPEATCIRYLFCMLCDESLSPPHNVAVDSRERRTQTQSVGLREGIKHRVVLTLSPFSGPPSSFGCRATLPDQDLVALWPCTRYL